MQRKFVTEYGLGFLNSHTIMLYAYELLSDKKMNEEQEMLVSESHIYAITSIPIVYFKKDSLRHQDNKLSGYICYKINGVEKEIEFNDFPWKIVNPTTSISCEYPYKKVINHGKDERYIPASFVAMFLNKNNEYPELNHYEILYIGQAVGNKANRTAMDRLKSHSTLQKILARTSHDFPDKEIMIFMYEFKHENIFTSIDGRAPNTNKTNDNEKRFFNAIDNLPDKKQKISLIEAALIRYFQPYYNEIFKNNFPSVTHKILHSCYDLDISGLIVEINCENLNYYLYSKIVTPKIHHIVQIDLFNSLDRESFFSFDGKNFSPDIIS